MKPAERVCFLNEQGMAERLRGPLASVRHWRRFQTGPPDLKIVRHVRNATPDVEAGLQTRLHLNGCAKGRVRGSLAFVVLVPCLVLMSCNTVPLIEPQPLAGNGSVDANRVAIFRGMARHGWEKVSEEAGVVVARLVSRGHMASVRISYDADSITIRYQDSEGLSCTKSGTSCSQIHRAYNRWVVQLRKDISSELSLARNLH
jgi:hypothetical protein